jgi:hypothetical protein
MATEYSSIDDLLVSGKTTTQPHAPEHQADTDSQPDFDGVEDVTGDKAYQSDPLIDGEYGMTQSDEPAEKEEPEEAHDDSDEYGNKEPTDNDVIRERLARQAESLKRKHQAEIDELRAQLVNQGASREVQQAAKDFEYDPNAKGDWQQQLASFVKQTVTNMQHEEVQKQQRAQEIRAHEEFQAKFHDGMSKFPDFVEVVSSQPISDAMTIATRSMKDPAAFLYAASKRHPQELQRIANISDPYAQIAEIGKLEERMRQTKPATKAPRPIARTQGDLSVPHNKKDREPTIEDLIARSDAKRLANMKQRGGRR